MSSKIQCMHMHPVEAAIPFIFTSCYPPHAHVGVEGVPNTWVIHIVTGVPQTSSLSTLSEYFTTSSYGGLLQPTLLLLLLRGSAAAAVCPMMNHRFAWVDAEPAVGLNLPMRFPCQLHFASVHIHMIGLQYFLYDRPIKMLQLAGFNSCMPLNAFLAKLIMNIVFPDRWEFHTRFFQMHMLFYMAWHASREQE